MIASNAIRSYYKAHGVWPADLTEDEIYWYEHNLEIE